MYEPITNAILPPKSGYVEVLKKGKHVYKNIKTGEISEREISNETSKHETNLLEMAIDHEYRIILLELGITEE